MCHPKGFKYNSHPPYIFLFPIWNVLRGPLRNLAERVGHQLKQFRDSRTNYFIWTKLQKWLFLLPLSPPPKKKKKQVSVSYRMSNNIRFRFVWQTKIPTKHPRRRPFIHQFDKKLRVSCRRAVRMRQKNVAILNNWKNLRDSTANQEICLH